jgi:hypothetical protein
LGRSETPYNKDFTTPEDVRAGLLDFIAEFANWEHSTNPDYLTFPRHLVQVAHESLAGEPGTRPLVVDPFAGSSSIPLEALRVGADAFASDLNPVAVLLNKVVLEYIPRYGQRLADEVRKWGAWVKEQAEKELAEFYPKDPDGATPIAPPGGDVGSEPVAGHDPVTWHQTSPGHPRDGTAGQPRRGPGRGPSASTHPGSRRSRSAGHRPRGPGRSERRRWPGPALLRPPGAPR